MKDAMALKITNTVVGLDVHLTINGVIDENVDLPTFDGEIQGKLVVNLEHLTMINSLGCRVWSKWIKGIKAKQGVVLSHCSPAFIAQVNVLQNFVPAGVAIESLHVPYMCASCNHREKLLYPSGQALGAANACPCPNCGAVMDIDVMPAQYFHFLQKKAA